MSGLHKWHDVQKEETAARVASAIDGLQAEGSAVSFYSVAERAQVARSTLYRRPELRSAVEGARNMAVPKPIRIENQTGLAREIAELQRKVDELSRQLPSTSYQCVGI